MSWLLTVLLSAFVGAPAPNCVIVEFTVDNCGPCRQLQPALDKLKSEGWDVQTVNAERDPGLVRKHSVESVPTLVFIANGKEVDRIVGAAPYEKILPRLAKLLLSSNSNSSSNRNISNSNPQQPSSSAINPSPQFGRNALTSNAPASNADKWLVSNPQPSTQANTPQPGITVRGQSPSGAFPLLAAATGSAISSTPSSREIAEKFEKFNATSGRLASNATVAPPESVPSASASPMPPRLTERMPAQLPRQQPAIKNAAPIDLQKAIARAEAATVRIRVDEENTTAYGTGTIIDVHGDEALVLTCGHLFREMKPHSQLTIDFFAGRSQPVNIPAQLIDFKADQGDVDIGLVSFKLPFAVEPVPLLPRTETLSVRQPAFSFGCDHGENPTRRDTQVKSINRYLGAPNIEIVGAPAVGRSGGGLFDNQGRLIGVCNAADAAGDEGIYAAADIVYAQIERLQLSHLFNSDGAPQNPTADHANNLAAVTPVAAQSQPSNLDQTDTPTAGPQSIRGASQITCIVRDASGREQIVRVDSPSSELLDAIYRQAASENNGLVR